MEAKVFLDSKKSYLTTVNPLLHHEYLSTWEVC